MPTTRKNDNFAETLLMDMTMKHVKTNYSPEDVFDESQLINWAENNGFVKPED